MSNISNINITSAAPISVESSPNVAAFLANAATQHVIAIYIPSTDNTSGHAVRIDNSETIKQALSQFSELFGGATAQPCIGAWMDERRGLETETVARVFAGCTLTALEEHLPAVIRFSEFIRNRFAQSAVTVELDGQLQFI